jgi:hypothetical protein
MRQFLGGNNTNTTAATVAYLKGTNKLYQANLVLFGELEDADALLLTDWSDSLVWSPWGTFLSSTLKVGQITSQVGLEVTDLTITWSPPVGEFTNDIATTSAYQRAQLGVYDNRKARIWRTIMPRPGDANTYGACEMFGGWIGSITVKRASIEFQISSFLNVINQKLPPNVIESTSTLAGFMAGTPVLPDAETSVPTFTVVAGSSALVILGDCIQPTANKIYGGNKLRNGYLVFLTGTLKGGYSAVAINSDFNAGGGIHHNQIQVFTRFPWDPSPGDTFYVATQPPINSQDPTGGDYQVYNFPFLPDPEMNL